MGSTMKPTVFNDQVVKALHKWHQKAKKQVKLNKKSKSTTSGSTRHSTPSHWTSGSTSNRSSQRVEPDTLVGVPPRAKSVAEETNEGLITDQHKIDVDMADFSFEKYVDIQVQK